ncbi:MAG: hypothetical protein RIT44_56 [Pseudomonadota bacterium]
MAAFLEVGAGAAFALEAAAGLDTTGAVFFAAGPVALFFVLSTAATGLAAALPLPTEVTVVLGTGFETGLLTGLAAAFTGAAFFSATGFLVGTTFFTSTAFLAGVGFFTGTAFFAGAGFLAGTAFLAGAAFFTGAAFLAGTGFLTAAGFFTGAAFLTALGLDLLATAGVADFLFEVFTSCLLAV